MAPKTIWQFYFKSSLLLLHGEMGALVCFVLLQDFIDFVWESLDYQEFLCKHVCVFIVQN